MYAMKTMIGILIVLSQCVQAQHRLDEYLRKAEANSPLLKEYAHQLTASSLQKDLIRSQQQLPQVSLTAGYLFAPFFKNNGRIVSTNPGPDAIGYDVGITNGGLYSAQINVEKPIFNARSIDAATDAQSTLEASVRNTVTLARRDLVKQVTDLYLQTYQSQKLYELSKETAAYAKQGLEILGGLVRQGSAKRSEYLLLSIEYESKNAGTTDAYAQYAATLAQLNTLCGIDDTVAAVLDSAALSISDEPGSESDVFLKKYALDSLAAQTQQQLAELKYQPQLSVFFNTGVNAVELDKIERKFGLSAGLNFSIPLFDGNQRSITRQQTLLSLHTIASYRQQFALQLKHQRKSSLDRLASFRAHLGALARQMGDYAELMQISENSLRLGQLSAIEYLTILRNYIDIKKERISTETEMQREINNYHYWN